MISRPTGASKSGARLIVAAALALAAFVTSPAEAQRKPSIVIMPAQYFSADAASAANLTRSLTQQYEQQGYTVIAADKAESAWQSMSLSPSTHYPDRVAVRFGRSAGADLVAYPRLLALGIPAVNGETPITGLLEPAAVVHLRVMNVHSGGNIYFRQIAHEFRSDASGATTTNNGTTTVQTPTFTLPEPVAMAAANEVSGMYFQRVAGSRQEFRRTGGRMNRR